MQIKLIKHKDGYIGVSDEEIKEVEIETYDTPHNIFINVFEAPYKSNTIKTQTINGKKWVIIEEINYK